MRFSEGLGNGPVSRMRTMLKWGYSWFAPFLGVPDVPRHLPHDLAVADLTPVYGHDLCPCRKSAGCDLPDPSRESYASRHGRTVNTAGHIIEYGN